MTVGILIPFIGTTLGVACVFFMKDAIKPTTQKMLLGFASDVMMVASVWSPLIPAMEMSEDIRKLVFTPTAVGLLVGIGLLLLMDKTTPHPYLDHGEPEGIRSSLNKTTMLALTVTLHNIPGGVVVNVVFAGILTGDGSTTTVGAFAPIVGIAIQNFPERAIISMPLKNEGKSKGRIFLLRTLSGIVEPIGAVATILLASYIVPILPYLLSFVADTMLYVVVEELIPETSEGEYTNIGTPGLVTGFVIMMTLDVALG